LLRDCRADFFANRWPRLSQRNGGEADQRHHGGAEEELHLGLGGRRSRQHGRPLSVFHAREHVEENEPSGHDG